MKDSLKIQLGFGVTLLLLIQSMLSALFYGAIGFAIYLLFGLEGGQVFTLTDPWLWVYVILWPFWLFFWVGVWGLLLLIVILLILKLLD